MATYSCDDSKQLTAIHKNIVKNLNIFPPGAKSIIRARPQPSPMLGGRYSLDTREPIKKPRELLSAVIQQEGKTSYAPKSIFCCTLSLLDGNGHWDNAKGISMASLLILLL